jgi:hypothetical protein
MRRRPLFYHPSNADLATAAGITDEPLSGSLFDSLSSAPDPPASRPPPTDRIARGVASADTEAAPRRFLCESG